MNIKDNRKISFILVGIVYLLAATLGIVVFLLLPFDTWISLLIADVAATVLTFIFSLVFSNASVYDPYWSVQPIVIVLAFALTEQMTLSKILLLCVIILWGVRLTANWAYTFHGLSHQDWRYTMLSEKTKSFYPIINFVGIHLVPTLVVYGVTLPAVFVIQSDASGNVFSVLAFLLSLFAVCLQGISDIQMHAFRKSRVGGFIRTGLWRYSRHPNYLGEILMWWGVALLSISVLGFRWYLPIGAIANTMLFLFVSIPMADARQSRKDGFQKYKAATRMLLPIKPFK